MSILKKVFDAVTKGIPKDQEASGKTYVRLDSVEQGHNILKAAEAEHASGKHQADVMINTATEHDLLEYLNYAVTLIPEKYALYKMLLVLRINPIRVNQATGRGVYLSKKFVADQLTRNLKKIVIEDEIDKLEKKAIQICQEFITKTRDTAIPILN
jgi:hypothetical protein